MEPRGCNRLATSFEITAPKGAEEVDHDRLEVLMADAWHCSSSTSNRSSPAD